MKVISRKKFFKLFKNKPDSIVEIAGVEFETIKAVQAQDFYAMCESSGLFLLPRNKMIDFFNMLDFRKNAGARIALAIILYS